MQVTKHIWLEIWFLDLVVSACKSDGEYYSEGPLEPPFPSPKAVSAQWQILSAFICFPSTCGRLPASIIGLHIPILSWIFFFLFVIVMTILSDLWIWCKSSIDTHSQVACKMSSFLEGNIWDHGRISVPEYSFVMSSSFSTFLRSVRVTI